MRCQSTCTVRYLLLVAASLIVISPLPSAQAEQQENQAAQPDKQASADQSSSEENQTKALAKAVQNPVASLISVPLQNNTNFDVGPNDRTQNILNIQPVIQRVRIDGMDQSIHPLTLYEKIIAQSPSPKSPLLGKLFKRNRR